MIEQGFGSKYSLLVKIGQLPIFLDPLSVVFIVLLGIYGAWYIRKHHSGMATGSILLAGFAGSSLIFVSGCLHELSHALVAYVWGVNIASAGTTWYGAYVHIPGEVTDFHPLFEPLVILAGPVSNGVMALACYYFVRRNKESLLQNIIQFVGVANWALFVWQLIPFFELDGYRVIRGLIVNVFHQSEQLFVVIRWLICILFIAGALCFRLKKMPSFEKRIEEPV